MKKSMKKADMKLAEARKYVAQYAQKLIKPSISSAELKQIKAEKAEIKKRIKAEKAEIKKQEKGHFFVIVTSRGQRLEIKKRFKSTTKAQEWISKHVEL